MWQCHCFLLSRVNAIGEINGVNLSPVMVSIETAFNAIVFEMAEPSKTIGNGQPCFIIAEAGVNHNGRVELALKLCNAARDAGADMVKFQAFKADSLVTSDAAKAEYQQNTTGEGSQAEMLRSLELSVDDFRKIQSHCNSIGIAFAASPFDESSLDMLVQMGG